LTTLQHIPEDSKFHTSRRENLKSHIFEVTKHNAAWASPFDITANSMNFSYLYLG
jgi:hypothetical protein